MRRAPLCTCLRKDRPSPERDRAPLGRRLFSSLQALVTRFGIGSNLVLHDLNVVADDTPGFAQAWHEVTEELRSRRDAKDPATLAALHDALPVRFHNIYVADVSSMTSDAPIWMIVAARRCGPPSGHAPKRASSATAGFWRPGIAYRCWRNMCRMGLA